LARSRSLRSRALVSAARQAGQIDKIIHKFYLKFCNVILYIFNIFPLRQR
jgi:hypothetical protein